MDRLKHTCEEWLGTEWSIYVDPKGYTVEFLYKQNNAPAKASFFKGVTEAEVINKITEQVPGLLTMGRMF